MRRSAMVIALMMVTAFLATLLAPKAFAAPGAPTSSIAQPWVGQEFTLTGSIGTPVVRAVELQRYTSKWVKDDSGMTSPDGSYSFTASTTASSRRFRVVAAATAALPSVTTDAITVTTRKDQVSLVVGRVGTTGTATGIASPVIAGRLFTLQYKSGSSWKQIGDAFPAGADGVVQTTFPISGTKTYRLKADAVDGSSGATSASVAFSYGPKTLGTHVISVQTDSGSTPKVKGKDYTATATIDNGPALDLETIAVRGNSTADKPKKPYKLKFEDKQKPFGMKSDKTWLLLANYADHTLIRSKIGLDLGGQMDGLSWSADSVFTELYLNGKYVGSYQLTQSIKIDKNRVDIDKETGVIIEIDPHFKEDKVPGFWGDHKLPYAFKDPDETKELDDGGVDPEGVTAAKVAGMKKRILDFEKVLYGSNYKDPENGWTRYLDMDSAVDYYLVREFTKDNDADFYRSNYFYTNDYDPATTDKLFLGPVWDFDRSAGAKPAGGSSSVTSPKGWWMRGNGSPNHSTNKTHWYVRITKDPAFQAALKARWAEKKGLYKAVGDSMVDAQVAELGKTVAANDRALWGKSGDRYPAKTSSYSGEIAWVKDWYQDRYKWMDDQLS